MRHVLVLTAAALALAACSPRADATTADATAASTATPPAPAAEGAEGFVRSLYSTGNGGMSSDEDDTAPWSTRTAALIAASESVTAEGDIGYFESDPICACQDDGGMMLRSVTVTPTGPDRADAAVVMEWTMAEPVETVRQTFNLVREGGAWKIDDIQRDQSLEFAQAPLVEDITRWTAEARAASAQ